MLDRQDFRMHWIFRGASERDILGPPRSLSSSLERACLAGGMSMSNLPDIETEIIRDFRRKYDGNDRQDVETDTLYCLSLMRHHGAPTRLVDWTYSPYVAAYFALEKWNKDATYVVIWCLNDQWCLKAASDLNPKIQELLTQYRVAHEIMQDEPEAAANKKAIFNQLFIESSFPIVYPVNAYHQHVRLTVQQGVFLCPGDVKLRLFDIITRMDDFDKPSSIIKLAWRPADASDWLEALEELQRININRASLFPGLDGFAESLKYRLRHYYRLSQLRR